MKSKRISPGLAAVLKSFSLALAACATYESRHAKSPPADGGCFLDCCRLRWLRHGPDLAADRTGGLWKNPGRHRGDVDHPPERQGHERTDHHLWRHHQGTARPGSERELHEYPAHDGQPA